MADLENFDRQYRAVFHLSGGTLIIGEKTKDYPFPLHCSFSFQKTDSVTANTGKMSIWNLTKEHINTLMENEESAEVEFYAGYGERLNKVFAGTLIFVSTSMDGADRKTDIEVFDNPDSMLDTYVSVSYDSQVSWKTIMQDAADQMGLPMDISEKATFTETQNGYQFVGLARDVMSKACATEDLSWSVQDGVIQLKKPNTSMSNQSFVVSASTGMIEMPVRVVVSGSYESHDRIFGYNVEILLNAAIHVDDMVYLDAKDIKGYYYVHSIDYQGDSTSGDWIMRLGLLEEGTGAIRSNEGTGSYMALQ